VTLSSLFLVAWICNVVGEGDVMFMAVNQKKNLLGNSHNRFQTSGPAFKPIHLTEKTWNIADPSLDLGEVRVGNYVPVGVHTVPKRGLEV
jgi:hypothetical protein